MTASMTRNDPIAPSAGAPLLVGLSERRVLRPQMWSDVLRIARATYGDDTVAATTVYELAQRMGDVRAAPHEKCIRVAGRYFFDLHCPGWPSPAFDAFVRAELARFRSFPGAPTSLQTIMFAITKKCPLRCEHCSEWNALNERETLTREDLFSILHRFQERGVAQVQLSGGEPLRRFDDLVDLIGAGSTRSDLWLLTSGHGLTHERARALRDAGLTGVQVSLDHWEAAAHDSFRGMAGAFSRAVEAATAAAASDLVVCLNLCATRAFVTPENLQRYASLAADLGAGFIQILEPRAVGRYSGQDVELSSEEERELEGFFESANMGAGRESLPIVTYQGYGQRRLGCPSAGDRFLFVDTDGRAHACPFCPGAAGDCRSGVSIDDAVAAVRARGCRKYPVAQICKTSAPGKGAP
jgi:MoaA/NifB/PqqE/SkfB family radical SAM enzyme